MSTVRTRSNPLLTTLGALTLSLGLIAGCDKGEAEAAKSKDEAAGDAKEAAASGVDEMIRAEAEKQGASDEVRSFLKDQSKLGCEMLTASMVATTLGVPEDKLKQTKVMGCHYNLKGDDTQDAQANLTMIRVSKDVDAAKRWFENSTRSQTKEEIAKQMEMVKSMAKKSDTVDTKQKAATVDTVGDMAVAFTPDEGTRYEDLAGLGDEARQNQHDGTVVVRVGNMQFHVMAYQGKPEPPADYMIGENGRPITDTKVVIKLAKEHQNKWLAETIDIRKEKSVALAKAILAEL